MTQAVATPPGTQAVARDTIRPFRVNIPETQIVELHLRAAFEPLR